MEVSRVRRMLSGGEIEVRRSARRKKTISVQERPGGWVLSVPMSWRPERNLEQISQLIGRLERRRAAPAPSDHALLERALELNSQLFGDGLAPTSVAWVTNQRSRFASTTPATGAIRVSHLLKAVPPWVLDAVLVHELAHLRVADHSASFKALTARYARSADAEVYLAGYSTGLAQAETPAH